MYSLGKNKIDADKYKTLDDIKAADEEDKEHIIEILGKDHRVDSYIVEESYKLAGINDLVTLKEIEEISRGIFKRAHHDQMKKNAMRALAMNRALHNFLG